MEVSRSHDADPLSANCPGREIFEMITSRWALLILWALKDDTWPAAGFSDTRLS